MWPECGLQAHSTEKGCQHKAESAESLLVWPTYQEGLLQPGERKRGSDGTQGSRAFWPVTTLEIAAQGKVDP